MNTVCLIAYPQQRGELHQNSVSFSSQSKVKADHRSTVDYRQVWAAILYFPANGISACNLDD